MVVKDTPIFVRVFKCRLLYFNDFSFSLKNEIRSFPQFLIFLTVAPLTTFGQTTKSPRSNHQVVNGLTKPQLNLSQSEKF